MRAPLEKPNARRAPGAGKETMQKRKSPRDSRPAGPSQASIAIRKGPLAEIRVSLKEWRGEKRVELREFTATIPGIFMSTAGGFSLEVGKAPELIAALQALTERRAP